MDHAVLHFLRRFFLSLIQTSLQGEFRIVSIARRSGAYVMADGRKVLVEFKQTPDGVVVTETFYPENENPVDMQQAGWQAILNQFKQYAEQ
jgi:hypothetical protein